MFNGICSILPRTVYPQTSEQEPSKNISTIFSVWPWDWDIGNQKKMEKEGKSKKSLNHKFPQQQLLITFTLFLIKNLNFLNLFSKGIVHSAM